MHHRGSAILASLITASLAACGDEPVPVEGGECLYSVHCTIDDDLHVCPETLTCRPDAAVLPLLLREFSK